jgi:effector-binding domain-containing protein
MNKIPEEIVKLTAIGEVKVKTTKTQEVASTVHKGSYQKLGAVFEKLVQWINENGYDVEGPSRTICYNDPQINFYIGGINEVKFVYLPKFAHHLLIGRRCWR